MSDIHQLTSLALLSSPRTVFMSSRYEDFTLFYMQIDTKARKLKQESVWQFPVTPETSTDENLRNRNLCLCMCD